jgi:hypothetical protein
MPVNLTPEYLASLRKSAEHMRDHNLALQDVRGEVTLALLDALHEARTVRLELAREQIAAIETGAIRIERQRHEIERRLRVAKERKDAGDPSAPACICQCHIGPPMRWCQCLMCGCVGPENTFVGDLGAPLP